MKKLMFTAIALVAFSGVSHADSGRKAKIIIKQSQCRDVWLSTRIYCLNQGMSDALACSIAFAAHDKCLGCDD